VEAYFHTVWGENYEKETYDYFRGHHFLFAFDVGLRGKRRGKYGKKIFFLKNTCSFRNKIRR
jgi:hypothetical protein